MENKAIFSIKCIGAKLAQSEFDQLVIFISHFDLTQESEWSKIMFDISIESVLTQLTFRISYNGVRLFLESIYIYLKMITKYFT